MEKLAPSPNFNKHNIARRKSVASKHSHIKNFTNKNLVRGFTTENPTQTKKLGELLAQEIGSGKIICLEGELGSGKTTFTQGLLKGLKIKGPYTSPTFVIMKKYAPGVFHLDAYRVSAKDILDLGWKEITAGAYNIVIVEWADRIKKIIPQDSLWIKFGWIDKNKREIVFNS